MSDHTQEAKDAKDAFIEDGRPVLIRTYTQTGPANNPTITPTDSDPTYALQTKAKKYEYDRGLVTNTSKVLLMNNDTALETSMKIVDDGIEFKITNIEPLRVGEGVIFYRVMIDG